MYIKEDGCYNLNKTEAERTHNLKISVTSKDIEDIIVTALECGIYYWAVLDNSKPEWADKPDGMPVSQYATQLLLEGKRLEFSDIEDTSIMYLTLDKLLDGIRLNAVRQSWDFDFDDFDSSTADCIFQYAMCGDIIYS